MKIATIGLLLICGCVATPSPEGPTDLEEARQNAIAQKLPVLFYGLRVSEPDTVCGIAPLIMVANHSEQDVKYINFELTPYNRVGDPVTDSVGRSTAQFRFTGPITPGKASAAQFTSWYDCTIKCAKLESVEIIYMDNTQKKIADPLTVIARRAKPNGLSQCLN